MTSRSPPRSSRCRPPAAVSCDKQPPPICLGPPCDNVVSGKLSTCLRFFVLCILLISSFPLAAAISRDAYLLDHFQRNLEPMIYDRTIPPPLPVQMQLEARQLEGSTTTNDVLPSKISAPTDPTSSTVGPGPLTTASPSGSALPKPFDTSLGNNFTSSSCPSFFNSFLNDKAFVDCLPLSLLLQTSNGFFQASRSALHLTQILDATCNVNFPTCSALMSKLASEIDLDQNCGADLALQNPTVAQAYAGLMAYEPLYRAGCLMSSTSSTNLSTSTPTVSPAAFSRRTAKSQNSTFSSSHPTYCFVDAITNASAPTSSYVYYLPLGVPLPPGTRPSCNKCLQETMQMFQTVAASQPSSSTPSSSTSAGSASANSNNGGGSSTVSATSVQQVLSNDYSDAAAMINTGCGTGFVKQSLKSSDASSSAVPSSSTVTNSVLPLMVLVWLFVLG